MRLYDRIAKEGIAESGGPICSAHIRSSALSVLLFGILLVIHKKAPKSV